MDEHLAEREQLNNELVTALNQLNTLNEATASDRDNLAALQTERSAIDTQIAALNANINTSERQALIIQIRNLNDRIHSLCCECMK